MVYVLISLKQEVGIIHRQNATTTITVVKLSVLAFSGEY